MGGAGEVEREEEDELDEVGWEGRIVRGEGQGGHRSPQDFGFRDAETVRAKGLDCVSDRFIRTEERGREGRVDGPLLQPRGLQL